MQAHSASERSVGYLFLMRARVANHYPTHPFRTVSLGTSVNSERPWRLVHSLIAAGSSSTGVTSAEVSSAKVTSTEVSSAKVTSTEVSSAFSSFVTVEGPNRVVGVARIVVAAAAATRPTVTTEEPQHRDYHRHNGYEDANNGQRS
jgi:hypothetical protein